MNDWWWLAVPAIIASVVWWSLLNEVLAGGLHLTALSSGETIVFALVALVAFGCMAGILLLAGFLIRSRRWRLGLSVITSLGLLFFFPLSWWTLAAGFVSSLAGYTAMHMTARDAESRRRVHPWMSMMPGAGIAVLGMITAVSLLFGASVERDALTPQERVHKLAAEAAKIIEHSATPIFPNITPDQTVDEAIGSQLPNGRDLLEKLGLRETLSSAQATQLNRQLRDDFGIEASIRSGQTSTDTEKQLDTLLQSYRSQAIQEVRQQLGDRVGVTLQGNQTITEALQSLILQFIEKPALEYQRFFGFAAAIAAWLLLRLFSIFFEWGTMVAGWVWYHALHLLKRVHITEHVEEIQQLEWGKG